MFLINAFLRLLLAVVFGGYLVMTVWFEDELVQIVQFANDLGSFERIGFAFLGFASFLFFCDVIHEVFLDDSEEDAANRQKVGFVRRLLQSRGPRRRVVRGLIKQRDWPYYIKRIEERLERRIELYFEVVPPDENRISHVRMGDRAAPDPPEEVMAIRSRAFSTKYPRYRERLIKETKLALFHELAVDVLGSEIVEGIEDQNKTSESEAS